MIAEDWVPVVGYEGSYEVSSLGRVRSLDRWVNTGNRHNDKTSSRFIAGRMLKFTEKNGYFTVNLKCEQKGDTQTVHKLVMSAFIGERPKGYHIDHINENKLDNRVTNLRYVTPKVNTVRSWSGNKRPQSKLNYEIVEELKIRYKNGETMTAMAKQLGCSHCIISKAINGITWNKYKGI